MISLLSFQSSVLFYNHRLIDETGVTYAKVSESILWDLCVWKGRSTWTNINKYLISCYIRRLEIIMLVSLSNETAKL